MQFNSLTFLYLFLPACLILVFVAPKRFRNLALLLASLVFYAWGGPIYLLVLIGSIALNYFTGMAMFRATTDAGRKKLFITGIVLNLLLLIVFKYTNFIFENVNVLTAIFGVKPFTLNHILLPLGISFYTFKAITYLVSANKPDAEAPGNLIDFALYLALFPAVIAGPIDRYQALSAQIKKRSVTIQNFSSGIGRFALGLFKKVVISGPLAYAAGEIFSRSPENLSTPLVWLGAVSYMLQVYYDFSGYTDMAIGLGRFFGFDLSENFNFPYLSRSIREFWKRWHISLSTWLRDYLFVPLTSHFFRSMTRERYLGFTAGTFAYIGTSLITFLICGIWHGAAWTFIVWGLIHGLLLSVEKSRFGKYLDKGPRLVGHIYVIMSLLISFVIFRSDSLPKAIDFLGIMVGIGGRPVYWPEMLEFLDREYILMVIIAIAGCTRIFENIRLRISKYGWDGLTIAGILITLILTTITLIAGTNNSFLYFQF